MQSRWYLLGCRASRVDLLAKLEEVKLKKEAADAAASAKRKILSGIQAELQKLAESAQPLREQLGLKGVPPVNQQAALLLPQPLYLIYMQLVAAGEAYDLRIAVTITGTAPLIQVSGQHESNITHVDANKSKTSWASNFLYLLFTSFVAAKTPVASAVCCHDHQ